MKALRVLSYAINGRGMGHLVRQLAILRWMRRYAELLGVRLEPWVLSSSEADTLARREGIPCIKIPSKSMIRDAGLDPSSTLGVMRGWVLSAVANLQPDLMLVDTFPGGTFGELAGVLEIPRRRVLVARPVQDWLAQEAAFRSMLPLYDRVIVPEPPEYVQENPPFDRKESYVGPILIREREELQSREAARAALGLCGRAVYLSLGGGGDPQATRILPTLVPQLRAAGWEVVVGAGPLYQGPELRGPGIVWLDRYVPVELFPAMDAAVSAGGYNSFHELMYCGVPTIFLPQPRLADDQAGRVQRAVQAGAGRVARSLSEVVGLLEQPGDATAARSLVPANGAREAAARVLSLLLPPEDVSWAQRCLQPALLSGLEARGLSGPSAMELLRVFGGLVPSEGRRQRELLEDHGILQPKRGSALERLLALLDRHGPAAGGDLPAPLLLSLCTQLSRRFPAASPAAVATSTERLLDACARFGDWMGLLNLLRAVPTQRAYTIDAFTDDLLVFIGTYSDIYEALRELAAAEGNGRLPLAEILKSARRDLADG